MSSARETVAVLGTGTMGAPMARNLIAAGYAVTAWNRNRERAEPLAEDGAGIAAKPAEAIAGAGLVITMFPTGDVVREVIEPALDEFADDAIWVQMSTIGAEQADRLGELASGHGVTYVDAPVSGTKEPAEQGRLVVLASGPGDARRRVQPLFDVIGAKTVWLGPAGSGSRMKLVVNNWLLAIVEGLAETIALAEGLKLEPERFLEVIADGPLDLPYAQLKGKAMLERSFDPSFALAMAAKDGGLLTDAAAKAGLELPLARAAAEQLSRGVDAGHGDEDVSAVIEVVRGGR